MSMSAVSQSKGSINSCSYTLAKIRGPFFSAVFCSKHRAMLYFSEIWTGSIACMQQCFYRPVFSGHSSSTWGTFFCQWALKFWGNPRPRRLFTVTCPFQAGEYITLGKMLSKYIAVNGAQMCELVLKTVQFPESLSSYGSFGPIGYQPFTGFNLHRHLFS